ncbi:transcription factor WhiB [Saccharothrix saharensis]|uniref:Transcriptional regulator WhiB n=1 Tax=Saccharothrix saharensis TaxID=571190 RepID=A0A543JR23_9PSEU|nr:transcription factor WhiB [Saccharothrix saharensis]
MNIDDTLRRIAADLDARYADYDLGAAQEDLENRLLAGSAGEQAPRTTGRRGSAVGAGSAEARMAPAELSDLLVAVAVDLTENPSAADEGWGPRLPTAVVVRPPARTDDWRARASCRDEEPDQLFVRGAEQRKAKLVCLGCPVRTECLAEALDNRIGFGVWGGMTERERRALLRRRPDVTSWRELLDLARREHGSDDAAAG